MKAWRVYGVGEMTLEEVDQPTVKPGWVLLRVRMVQLSVTEIQMFLKGDSLMGAQRKWEARCRKEGPLQVFGHEFCGEVVQMIDASKDLKIGDRVFWRRNTPCGHCALCAAGYGKLCRCGSFFSREVPGALGEYTLAPIDDLVKIPDTVTDSEAAGMQSLFSALDFVTSAEINVGDVVALLGQGVTGLNCLQLVRYCGASKVIGVDVRAENLTLSHRLGADLVVNANELNPAEKIKETT
jgi:threonine dehydrogenase-like Zn-dependent dehydrogenase